MAIHGNEGWQGTELVSIFVRDRISGPRCFASGTARNEVFLEKFKQSFANTSSRLYTHEIICDPAAYARLSQGRKGEGYFPAYRAPR